LTEHIKRKILVVDDDAVLLREVKVHLEKVGYEVTTAENGHEALGAAKAAVFDLVVLDINFPNDFNSKRHTLDGIEVLRMFREMGDVPILMLSATNISSVKVMALTIGADDYVSKPFEIQELGARIEAILRRSAQEPPGGRVLSLQRLRLDPGERRVWKDGKPVELTGTEFDILYTIARRPEHVFTREKLIEHAWKNDSNVVPKAVDVHMGHIRKKIEDNPVLPAFIVTVRGTGYRFEDAGS